MNKTMVTPPLQPGHPCRYKRPASDGKYSANDPVMVLVATKGAAAWVHDHPLLDPSAWPKTVALADLETALPPVQKIELTPGEQDQAVEHAKLQAVARIVRTIQRADSAALDQVLYRLTLSFKNRLILDPNDDATPEQMAQGLLTSVLMAALTVEVAS